MAKLDVPIGESRNPAEFQVQKWMNLIDASCQREDKWRKDAKKYLDLYEAQKTSENSFNILYANTETMRPAVLSAVPRPRVRQRWDNSLPIATIAATATERLLSFLADSGSAAQSPFASTLKECVRQALVPGRGLAMFQYEPDIQEYATSGASEDSTQDSDQEAVQDPTPSNIVNTDSDGAGTAATGASGAPSQMAEKVGSETICGYNVPYDRVVFGYATTWTDIPWLAIELLMTRGDLAEKFGKEKTAEIPLNKQKDVSKPNNDGTDSDETKGVPNTASVWAVWHKEKRQVIYVCRGYPDGPLDTVSDPLGLSGFFPIPEQLTFFLKSQSLIPVPLYEFYRQQARELNNVSIRINKIISVMKARGLYDKTLVDLDQMRALEDGQMQPVGNMPALGQNASLDKAVWMWPIEKLIAVLQQLYVQREQVKQVIYEISGLSDIIRGSTVASETATAQKIKNQWGTLRLQDAQNAVGAFARNCFRIMAEIAINKFMPETWERMTGMQLPMAAEKQQAQLQLQQIQQQGQQLMQQAQAAGVQDPKQLPPQIQQQGQQMQQQAKQLQDLIAKPSWEDVLAELKKNVADNYLIDIQTNSTIDAAMTEDKADITALVTAISQMMQALGPAIQSGAIPVALVKTLLMSVMRSYRFGDEIMDQIRALPDQMPQQPQKQDPAVMKAQAEISVLQAKSQIDQKNAQAESQFKAQQLQFEQQQLQMKEQEAAFEHESRMQELADKRAASQERARATIAKIQLQSMQQPAGPTLNGPTPQAGAPSAAI